MAQIMTAAGVQISYDDKKENLIQRHLSALLASFARPDGGLMIGFQISPPLHVLGSMIRIAGITGEDVTRSFIFQAAIGFQNQPTPSVTDFIEAVGRKAHDYLARPSQEYRVILPLNLEYARIGDNRVFTICGTSLQCENWANVQRTYAIDKLIGTIHEYLSDETVRDLWHWSGAPLICRAYAKTSQDAFRRAFDAYDLLCAILNITHDTDGVQLARPKPMASVYPAAGYGVFLPDGALAEGFVIEENLAFQGHLASLRDLQPILQVLDELNHEQPLRHSTQRFNDALKSFGSALGTTDWSKAYLSLWQALEILTFGPQRKYDMNQVAERALILARGNDIARDFLTMCAGRRNDLIHRGQFSPDGQSEVILLKQATRICLWRYFALRGTYQTEESLIEYFNHAPLSDEKLIERKRVIDTILGEE